MKISREWLLEFIDFSDIPFEEITELITTRVAEIEDVYSIAEPCKNAIIVKVTKVDIHPKKDSLKIVDVTDGKNSFQVVCGAKNVREGMLTVYLPIESFVRSPDHLAEEEILKKIELKEISGVQSNGILVSESELGVGPSHEGIMDLLDGNLEVGSSVSSLGLFPDRIFDIDNKSLTHRPDLWCHYGFARELSAILKRPLKSDFDKLIIENDLVKLKAVPDLVVINENSDDCRRASFLAIDGISNGPAPLWLKKRLFSVGAGTRNLLVDLSNYILHDIGQPNHAYDVKKLRGNVIQVRRSTNNETFIGLDGEKRTLTVSDLVMADEQGPIALAGVIGGNDFSISDSSASIILEAANFDPVLVRKTCKEHNLRTDSSVRFEKSLSSEQTVLAPIRFIDLLKRIGITYQLVGYTDSYDKKSEDIYVEYDPLYIQERLGGVPDVQEIDAILTSLKFQRQGNALKVPYYRATKDISIADDLVEEVGRTIGYERVPSIAPEIRSSSSKRSNLGKTELKIRELLSSEGFTEVYCYTFASKERTHNLGYNLDPSIEVQNSVDKNLNIVQLTLVPNMLDVLNLNNKNLDSFYGFEIGRAYYISDDSKHGYAERRLCSISAIDSRKNDSLQNGSLNVTEGALFYGVRKSIERLIYSVSGKLPKFQSYNLSSDEQGFFSLKDWMHPYRAAKVIVDSKVVGVISEVKPSLLDIKGSRAVISEIDIEAILLSKSEDAYFKPFSRFPKSHFEVSLVVKSRLEYGQIEKVFVDAFKEDVCETEILPFSIYRGAPLNEDEKSISLRFTFSLPNDTLSGEQIERLQSKVLETAKSNNYHLRG